MGWIVRALYGDRRSSEGYLLLKRNYVLPEQERVLRRCYPGLLGFVVFIGATACLVHKYGVTWGHRRTIGFWPTLPLGTKIASAALFPAFLVGWVSGFRLVLTANAIGGQPLSDLEAG